MPNTVFIHAAGLIPDRASPADYPVLARLLALCPDLRVPVMPDALNPTPEAWLRGVDGALSPLGPQDVVIAHSLGASMVLKWLAARPAPFQLASFLSLAAPFWGLSGWEYEGFGPPQGFGPMTDAIGRIALCQCKDDDVVTPEHLQTYARAMPLASATLLETGGHMLDTADVDAVLRAAVNG